MMPRSGSSKLAPYTLFACPLLVPPCVIRRCVFLPVAGNAASVPAPPAPPDRAEPLPPPGRSADGADAFLSRLVCREQAPSERVTNLRLQSLDQLLGVGVLLIE